MKTTPPANIAFTSLQASCNSLSDFFQRLENLIAAIGGNINVTCGSLGVTDCHVIATDGDLCQCEDYVEYKREALQGGTALLTSLNVGQDGREITFCLDQWKRCTLPVKFDSKMIQRAILSQLAVCFPLRSNVIVDDEVEQNLGAGHEVAYLHAIEHFEKSAAALSNTNEETASAVREFLTHSARQIAEQHRQFTAALETEVAQRRKLFTQHLQESDQLDVRSHGIARRKLLADLEALTEKTLEESTSEVTTAASRSLSRLCIAGLIGGVFLAIYGLLVVPLTQFFAPSSSNLPPNLWTLGLSHPWVPAILFGTGLFIATACGITRYLQLLRCQRRREAHDAQVHSFQRDLLRMGWVSELYLEAVENQRLGEDSETALPDVLLERFSRSLFGEDSNGKWTGEKASIFDELTPVKSGSKSAIYASDLTSEGESPSFATAETTPSDPSPIASNSRRRRKSGRTNRKSR